MRRKLVLLDITFREASFASRWSSGYYHSKQLHDHHKCRLDVFRTTQGDATVGLMILRQFSAQYSQLFQMFYLKVDMRVAARGQFCT